MNCLSNWPDCAFGAGVLACAEARRDLNSLGAAAAAGGGAVLVSPGWNRAVLIDCTIPEGPDVSPSACRDAGTITTKNSATRAETPTAAAKRTVTLRSALRDSSSFG